MFRFLNLTLNGVSLGMIYAAVALALVMIWRATRIVNFAQGGMLMFTTFIAWDLAQRHHINYWVALAVAVGAGLVIGAVAERLLVRPVENGPPLNAVIVTLGLLIFLQALAGMIWGNAQAHSYSPAYSIVGYSAGDRTLLFSPNDVYIVTAVLIVVVVLYLLFQRTSLGLQMRAAAFSPEVARLLGVRVGRLLTLGWAIAAALGALAGILAAGTQTGYVQTVGPFDALLVYGFTAAVIGGLDSPIGAVIGGLLLGIVLSYADSYVSNNIQTMYAFLILIAVLMVRPNGLFSRSAARRV
ncbi:MAG: branched-chain amino acid transport system permease protein [Frankiaceae bacterium]|nr:branched-chain amino acid transport system permease protein [Frankiaceae bacterium]